VRLTAVTLITSGTARTLHVMALIIGIVSLVIVFIQKSTIISRIVGRSSIRIRINNNY
jgi:hypothetical protein